MLRLKTPLCYLRLNMKEHTQSESMFQAPALSKANSKYIHFSFKGVKKVNYKVERKCVSSA